ncbi:MAG: PIN domain-containing protein [Fibrobacter sp.]|nr:PIN domain-containing protein [Fibrobacter sp.]
MSDKAFLDTNILIYAYSEDEKSKALCARKLFTLNVIVSTQCISELSNVLIRKFGRSSSETADVIHEITSIVSVAVITLDTIREALKLSQKYSYSFYDSQIIASALENNCRTIFTEDMHNDQIIEGFLKLRNPFL